MADDDEIDVLGDSNLNFLSKTDVISYEGSSLISENNDLLNCEYTIHPQWLLDKPSTNPDNWYNTSTSAELMANIQIENDALRHLSTENCISDESGWTEKEKSLLERGIGIFGKSNVRLSQFVGSKTSAEIRYYMKHFYTETHPRINSDTVSGSLGFKGDVLDENQIPASIEEVIAAVSTAKPTMSRNVRKFSSGSSDSSIDNSPSKSLIFDEFVEDDQGKKAKYSIKNRKRLARIKGKLKLTSKLSKSVDSKPKQNKKTPRERSTNQKDNRFMRTEITTGKGLAVPVCEGEEIVRLKKVDDNEDDVEVDVDLSDEDNSKVQDIKETNEKTICNYEGSDDQRSLSELKQNNNFIDERLPGKSESKVNVDLSNLDEGTLKQITSMEIPECEMVLDSNHITELEKAINWDYFAERQSKTPQRYLRIRTYMINMWLMQKPKYLHKTSSRQGLKNCGDVNDVGRIHQILEQMGVINFGCEQVKYIRPLKDMIYTQPVSKDKPPKENNNIRPIGKLGMRQRIKKKFIQDGEGGCTLTHGEQGEVIHETIVNEEPPIPKPKVYSKKPLVRLIYCEPFTEKKPQPYSIRMHLSTILTMDFHAHLSTTEVMGLVAGYWIPQSKSVVISHYEPCLNIASSAIHCDMCPISQAKAFDSICSKELDVIGWFHSHPTFAPEPSQQDLETQETVQQWIGYNKPCLGVILSPFSANGALVASPFRCLAVENKTMDQLVPYKFKVEIITDNFDIKDLLKNLVGVLNSHLGSINSSKIDFMKPYFLNPSITHLNKFMTSVNMQLTKCGMFDKMTCDGILQEITDLFHGN